MSKSSCEETIKNTSPLRYPGGKTRACKKLNDILNMHFEVSEFHTIISPFFGGGSFEFYLQSNYGGRIVANDKFQPLSNFWNICKTDKEGLCEILRKNNKISKKTFQEYRSSIMSKKGIEQAAMYFTINRCSFSGSTLSGGFSLEASKKRFTKSSIDRVEKLDLRKFLMYNMDFADFIPMHKKGFMFLDPPYYFKRKSKNKLYGKDGDMHEAFDHEKLHKILRRRTNWMMTYNNCNYIRNLYKGFKIIETNWSYGMNKSKESSEIVILSP
jgi:DNA adenine methylase